MAFKPSLVPITFSGVALRDVVDSDSIATCTFSIPEIVNSSYIVKVRLTSLMHRSWRIMKNMGLTRLLTSQQLQQIGDHVHTCGYHLLVGFEDPGLSRTVTRARGPVLKKKKDNSIVASPRVALSISYLGKCLFGLETRQPNGKGRNSRKR